MLVMSAKHTENQLKRFQLTQNMALKRRFQRSVSEVGVAAAVLKSDTHLWIGFRGTASAAGEDNIMRMSAYTAPVAPLLARVMRM